MYDKNDEYREKMCEIIKAQGGTYWDILAKTDEERYLLQRLRRTKMGKLCESLYADPCDSGFWEDGDTFASEVLYRVGYEIGHWYQDVPWMTEDERARKRYPDGITPSNIYSAKQWVFKAEKMLGVKRQLYFGGAF